MGLAVVPLVIMAVAAATKGVSDVISGNAKAAVARRNAEATAQAAGMTRLEGDVEAQKIAYKASNIEAAARARMGKSGVLDISMGSPLELVADSHLMATHQMRTTMNVIERKALGFEAESASYAAEARQAEFGGYLSAAGSILGGAAQVAGAAIGTPGETTGAGPADYGSVPMLIEDNPGWVVEA